MSDQENDAGSDEEYEIEQVLDCDYERFEQGKWAYLVSWKGYGPDDNSWVREEDAENAQEMLDEFWEHNSSKREAVERAIAAKKAKAAASKKRSRASGSRGSMERDVSSSQKRARQGSSSRDQRAIEVDDFDDEEDEAAAAAAQREDPIARKKKKDMEAKRRLAAVGDWDPLVERVETVERNESGELVVFLTFNTGEQLAYQSDVCRTRCPQALIKFYEQHLRFRDSSGSNAAAAAAKDADAGAVMAAAAAAAKEEEEKKKKNGGSGAIEVVDDDDDIVMTGSGQQHQ